MVSSADNRKTVQAVIVERINNYSRKRKRDQKKGQIASDSLIRLNGRKGSNGGMEEDTTNEEQTRMAAGGDRVHEQESNNNRGGRGLPIKREEGTIEEGEETIPKRKYTDRLRFDSDDDGDSSESSILDV